MPLQQTTGNVTTDAYGGGVAAVPNYIEDVFSTYLYTGNASTQTITNGIDLAGKGGLVWIKTRSLTTDNKLTDTVRGATKALISNTSAAQTTDTNGLTSFGSTGFSIGTDSVYNNVATYASWTFRKQPKFFDVVTYTGDGTTNRVISHSLGSTPGCVMWKRTSSTSDWFVQHRSVGPTGTSALKLNTTAAASAFDLIAESGGAYVWDSTSLTLNSDVFNTSGQTFVLYIFAHNAGGFGLTGTDNVISCGSYTGNGGLNAINLGYEAQWVMIKDASTTAATSNWGIYDNMRGMPNGTANTPSLNANLSNAEASSAVVYASATGFTINDASGRVNGSGETYIYIAIRRGPMKVPTSGTSVFALSTWTGSSGNKDLGSQTNNFGTGYFAMLKMRTSAQSWGQFDQLRGSTPFLDSDTINTEIADPGGISVVNNKLQINSGSYFGAGGDGAGQNFIGQIFRRAPSFFDEVCYTGNGGAQTLTHNLGIAPELIISRVRNVNGYWYVDCNFTSTTVTEAYLNTTDAGTIYSYGSGYPFVNQKPTSTQFVNGFGTSGYSYVSYLFATCAGVSKVGSYTGTGATQTISCGFTGGARFVLIKRTDSTGDWYVWDTTRGMVSGTDPSLLLNTSAAEVNANSIYTTTGGFQIVSTAAGINASGGSYIFLAIA